MDIKLSKFKLKDLYVLSDTLDSLPITEDAYNSNNIGILIDQLRWSLSKNNLFIRSVLDKRKKFENLLLELMLAVKTVDNIEQQLLGVLNTPFSDLPLLINDIKDPFAKTLLSWRMKINK